jgi:hypothetical protein
LRFLTIRDVVSETWANDRSVSGSSPTIEFNYSSKRHNRYV